MSYQVKLEQFAGPLEKLLELIEERKLEITTVNLASVTGEFLNYLSTLEARGDAGTIADFVAVAAKLVLVKSKVLLPDVPLTAEEEGEIRDLESQLRLYREIQHAGVLIKNIWSGFPRAGARPFFFAQSERAMFYPPPGLRAEGLAAAIHGLVRELKQFIPETRKVERAVITLEERMKRLLARFTAARRESFHSLAEGESKAEAIVLFLAILHLLKDRLLSVRQEQPFGDILIQKTGGSS